MTHAANTNGIPPISLDMVFSVVTPNANVHISLVFKYSSGFTKSFHTPTKAPTPTATIMGVAEGRMIRKNIPKSVAPSISALSLNSFGSVRRYCTTKKILTASPPHHIGQISGCRVFSQPKSENMVYRGIIVTVEGIIIVPSTTA